jgi:SET domain-containing protein
METYKPLPKEVAVRVSPIHGYGLFAIDNITYGTSLGVSHIFAVGFKDDYIRTPLGGFINHSDTPNCSKVQSHEDSALTYYILQTIKDIKKGEELTVAYTIYSVKKSFKVAKNGSCPAEGVL